VQKDPVQKGETAGDEVPEPAFSRRTIDPTQYPTARVREVTDFRIVLDSTRDVETGGPMLLARS
jgi:hypothetical protein